jgi:hypothetical protein
MSTVFEDYKRSLLLRLQPNEQYSWALETLRGKTRPELVAALMGLHRGGDPTDERVALRDAVNALYYEGLANSTLERHAAIADDMLEKQKLLADSVIVEMRKLDASNERLTYVGWLLAAVGIGVAVADVLVGVVFGSRS